MLFYFLHLHENHRKDILVISFLALSQRYPKNDMDSTHGRWLFHNNNYNNRIINQPFLNWIIVVSYSNLVDRFQYKRARSWS